MTDLLSSKKQARLAHCPVGFSCLGGFPYGACEKNYSINAGKIGTNTPPGCCFNLSRHKAIERAIGDLKLSRLGSYNRWGYLFACHFQDSMHLL